MTNFRGEELWTNSSKWLDGEANKLNDHGIKGIFRALGLICVLLTFCGIVQGTQQPLIKLKVVSEIANIRQNPDIGSAIIHQLPQGTILQATAKQGEWYVIQMKLGEDKVLSGFVHESLVIVIEGPALPAPKEKTITEPVEIVKEPEGVEELEEVPAEDVRVPAEKPSPSVAQQSRFRVSFCGGMASILVGDLNTGAKGLGDYYEVLLGESKSGEVAPLHTANIFEGELNMALSSKLFLNIGAAYLSGKKESHVDYPDGTYVEVYATRPSVRSIPFRLSLSYYPNRAFYIKLGGEYHLAKCAYTYRYEEADFWQEWKGDASAQGLGVFGGLGIEINPSGNVCFFIETLGRYCRITNFEGTDEYSESTGAQSTESGTLYIYQGHITERESYPLLYIRERKPSEAGVSDAKVAAIDLSGFEVRVGIRFKF